MYETLPSKFTVITLIDQINKQWYNKVHSYSFSPQKLSSENNQ